MEDSDNEAAVARREVTESQREINSIKAAILKLEHASRSGAAAAATNVVEENKVQVSCIKMSNALETNERLSLQISSPIEEAFLYEINSGNDNDDGGGSTNNISSVATFAGVEVNVATLTVSLQNQADGSVTVVGESVPLEMETLCQLKDPFHPQDKYTKDIDVTLVTTATFNDDDNNKEDQAKQEEEGTTTEQEKTEEAEAKKEEEEQEAKEEQGETKDETTTPEEEATDETKEESEEKEEEAAAATEDAKEEAAAEETKAEEDTEAEEKQDTSSPPATTKVEYTLTLRISYSPSIKDQKEELIRLLNKASERRTEASKKLRQVQQQAVVAASAPKAAGGPMTTTTAKGGPAVQAGFLNKKKDLPQKEETLVTRLTTFYNKYLGPASFLQAAAFPIGKNYVIFFGVCVWMHYKGQELALPAPV